MDRRARRLVAAAYIASAVFSAAFIWRASTVIDGHRTFTLFDDAMISMRFARNLAHGHALAWNTTGSHVEGYTSLAWTIWMAFLHLFRLTGSATALLVQLTGAGLLLLNIDLVRRITGRLAPQSAVATTVTVWLTALCFPLVYWTLRGMEIGLLAVLISAAVLFALRILDGGDGRDGAALATMLSLAVLTRTDGLVPALIVLAFLTVALSPERRRSIVFPVAGVVVGTLGLRTIFSVLYYGDPLPNTSYLAVQGVAVATRVHRGAGDLITLITVDLFGPLALAAVALWHKPSRTAIGGWLIGALFAGQCAYSVAVGGDAWDVTQFANRHIAVALPMLLVLAGLGLARLLEPLVVPRTGVIVLAGLLVTAALGRAVDLRPALDMQFFHPPGEAVWWRLGAPVLLAAAVSLATWARRAEHLTFVVALVALLAVASGRDTDTWARHNAIGSDSDARMTRYGMDLNKATRPKALLAVGPAGAQAYSANRPASDMSGRSDRKIAHGHPGPGPFIPGYTKFDYRHSIYELRPDVVTGLVQYAIPADVETMRSWGYDEIGHGLFVRRDSTLVDRAALRRALDRAHLPIDR